MSLYTSGYTLWPKPWLAEVTDLVGGNQLDVEHRFFGRSRPRDADWSTQLTIRQAAADLHHIVRSFRRIYDRPWITSGTSKDGMTAVYHRRFYPDDVAGTVAFGAPNDVVDDDDSGYEAFWAGVGTPSCRTAVLDVQRRLLGPDRAWYHERLLAALERRKLRVAPAMVAPGHEGRLVDVAAAPLGHAFWAYQPLRACRSVPGPDASRRDLWRWAAEVSPPADLAQGAGASVMPYYYQALTQLGWADETPAAVMALVSDPTWFTKITLPSYMGDFSYDPTAVQDIDRWVRTSAERTMFLYGENDPWSVEPFSCGEGAGGRACSVHAIPRGNHVSGPRDLPRAERRATIAVVRRWAGLSPGSAGPHIVPREFARRVGPGYRDPRIV